MTRLPYNSHPAHFTKYEDKKPTKYSNVKTNIRRPDVRLKA